MTANDLNEVTTTVEFNLDAGWFENGGRQSDVFIQIPSEDGLN